MARKMTKKEKYGNRLAKMDANRFKQSAEELKTKRDTLLQEVLEIKNRIANGNGTTVDDIKLKHYMTEVVLCEKLIGNFGKFH